MQTHEITRRFIDHFTGTGHTRVPSASLILDDPNLLFVNAGMVSFKPYFLGEAPPPYARAVLIQKCLCGTNPAGIEDAVGLLRAALRS